MYYLDIEEIKKIAAHYGVTFAEIIEKKITSPDSAAYIFYDNHKKEHLLIQSDYLSEPKYEAIGFEKEFNYKVLSFIKLLQPYVVNNHAYPYDCWDAKGWKYLLARISPKK
jgi:hypothetical protein